MGDGDNTQTQQEQDERKSGINPDYQLPQDALIPYNVINPNGAPLQFGQNATGAATAPAPQVSAPQAAEAAKVAPAAPQGATTPLITDAGTAPKPPAAPNPAAPVPYAKAVQETNPWAGLNAKISPLVKPDFSNGIKSGIGTTLKDALKVLGHAGVGAGAGAEGMSKEYPQIEAGREAAAKEVMQQPLEWAKTQQAAEKNAIDMKEAQAKLDALQHPKLSGEIYQGAQPNTWFRTTETGASVPTDVQGTPLPEQGVAPVPTARPAPAVGGGTTPIPAAATPTQTPAWIPGAKVGEKPTVVPQAEQPAATQAIADFQSQLAGVTPNLSPKQRSAFEFPAGYVPTNAELKDQRAAAEHADELAHQGKQDELNNTLKQQMDALTIQTKQQELDAKKQAAQTSADNLYYNLYDQDNYADSVKDWHASGSFAKDSGLIAEQVKGESGGGEGGGGGFGLGILAKTPMTAIGAAGADFILNQAKGILDGYTDTLIKAGISTKGQEVLQNYTQAVLSRLQFDMTVGGQKASTMRMRDLMRLAMQNVPQPNLEEKDFNARFKLYHEGMQSKVERNTPKNGYTPPPNPYKAGGNVNTVPQGAQGTYKDKQGNVIGYRDASGKDVKF